MTKRPIFLIHGASLRYEQTASAVYHATNRPKLAVGHRAEEVHGEGDGQDEHVGDARVRREVAGIIE